jgi:hypothetical protein
MSLVYQISIYSSAAAGFGVYRRFRQLLEFILVPIVTSKIGVAEAESHVRSFLLPCPAVSESQPRGYVLVQYAGLPTIDYSIGRSDL